MTKRLQKIIEKIISDFFNQQKARVLGGQYTKSIMFSIGEFDPKITIPYLYTHANMTQAANHQHIDDFTVNKLVASTENYIEMLKQKTTANMIRTIGDSLVTANLNAKANKKTMRDFFTTKDGEEILKEIKSSLGEQKKKINKAFDQIVNVETMNAQNLGAADGIVGMSKSLGIDDPVCFKIGVNDEKRCIDCWNLWTLPDKVTPKLYKLSELVSDPGNKLGKRKASVGLSHPSCRDVITTLLPGFGFDSSGKVVYVGKDHDEYAKQRGK